MTHRHILIIACLLGFLGVGLGAFGAHALKTTLVAHGKVDVFELAVRYQFYHALVLLFVGLYQTRLLRAPAILFLLGTLMFSGSLYYLALTNSTALVFVTPVGGTLLLAGWGTLLVSLIRFGRPAGQ